MAKLLIVESPTKAKTIRKFLGAEYLVESSFGHIRDLPKKEIGVDTEHSFQPTYVVPDDKKRRVADLKRAAKQADEVYLATDSDREGEAIAWHITQVLGVNPKTTKRITFHEITKSAIEDALGHATTIDDNLVNAQQTRRILDRLVGYKLSPFLWQKVQRGLSAGRVQSVAVRIIVERERERNAFNQEEYWTIENLFAKDAQDFEGKLSKIDGKKLDKLAIKNEEQAQAILDALKEATYTVDSVEKKQASRKPPTPLTTSTLQQEANSKLGFGAKQTMTIAQKLYETGRITYMRTDSLNLADKFLGEAQGFLQHTYGDAYAKGPVAYKTKKKGAQEAHEAIRPTDIRLTPQELEGKMEPGQWKLYNLIWRRTLASQMPSAKLERTGIDISAANYTFRASGSTIVFDGFMKVYKSAKETILPDMASGDVIDCKEITPKQHFTQPPPRYSDATLVKVLEEYGIGRPSTYAPTIGTIIARGYVERDDNKKLAPTDTAMIVTDVLTDHFPSIVDYEFTARLEQSLDEIAEGKIEWAPMLEGFYGPFAQQIIEKSDSVSREDVMKQRELGTDPKTGKTIYVKTGRYGPYVQLGEWDKENDGPKPKMASLLKEQRLETVTLEDVLPLFDLPRTVGTLEDKTPITAQIGPYGPYLKAGKMNASLPEEYTVFDVTEEQARVIIREAITVREEMKKPIAEFGNDPVSGKQILIKKGRFGPYVTDGETNASVPKAMSPEDVTEEQAIALLEKKRKRNEAKGGKKKSGMAGMKIKKKK